MRQRLRRSGGLARPLAPPTDNCPNGSSRPSHGKNVERGVVPASVHQGSGGVDPREPSWDSEPKHHSRHVTPGLSGGRDRGCPAPSMWRGVATGSDAIRGRPKRDATHFGDAGVALGCWWPGAAAR